MRSLGESLPSILKTNLCSIVDMAGLIEESFNKPALYQSSIKHSPMVKVLPVFPVIAIITMSEEVLL